MSRSDWVAKVGGSVAKHWRDALLFVGILYTLIVPPLLRGAPGTVWACLSAGIFCIAFSRIHLFDWLKIGPFHAKLREVERATQEAYATIEKLRSLAGVLVSGMATLYGSGGRGGGAELTTAVSNRKKQRQFLVDQLSFSPGDADACFEATDRTVESSLAKDLDGEISDALAGKDKLSRWDEVKDRLFDPSGDIPAPPGQWRSCIENLGLGDVPKVMEALKDYEHYLKFRERRRPETLDYTE